MRALQALVAFLGILIFLGLGLVVYAMTQGPKSSSALRIVATVPAHFVLPSGFHIAEMATTADRVVLRLDASDGRQRLVILDPGTGLVVRTIDTVGTP